MNKNKKVSDMTIEELEYIINLFISNCHYSQNNQPYIYNPYNNGGNISYSDHTEVLNEK